MPKPVLPLIFITLVSGLFLTVYLYGADRKHQRQEGNARNAASETSRSRQSEHITDQLIPPGHVRGATPDGIVYGTQWLAPGKCAEGPYCHTLDLAISQACPKRVSVQIRYASVRPGDTGIARASQPGTVAGQRLTLIFRTYSPPVGTPSLVYVSCT